MAQWRLPSLREGSGGAGFNLWARPIPHALFLAVGSPQHSQSSFRPMTPSLTKACHDLLVLLLGVFHSLGDCNSLVPTDGKGLDGIPPLCPTTPPVGGHVLTVVGHWGG